MAWTAQRELAAQVIRGVEAHKAAAAFLRTAAARMDPSTGTVPSTVPRRMSGQRDGVSNCRTGDQGLDQGGGLAGDWQAGYGHAQGPTV